MLEDSTSGRAGGHVRPTSSGYVVLHPPRNETPVGMKTELEVMLPREHRRWRSQYGQLLRAPAHVEHVIAAAARSVA